MQSAWLRGRPGLADGCPDYVQFLQLSAEDSRAGRGKLSSEADADGNKWGNKLQGLAISISKIYCMEPNRYGRPTGSKLCIYFMSHCQVGHYLGSNPQPKVEFCVLRGEQRRSNERRSTTFRRVRRPSGLTMAPATGRSVNQHWPNSWPPGVDAWQQSL